MTRSLWSISSIIAGKSNNIENIRDEYSKVVLKKSLGFTGLDKPCSDCKSNTIKFEVSKCAKRMKGNPFEISIPENAGRWPYILLLRQKKS